jgi:hypothetical protein
LNIFHAVLTQHQGVGQQTGGDEGFSVVTEGNNFGTIDTLKEGTVVGVTVQYPDINIRTCGTRDVDRSGGVISRLPDCYQWFQVG